SRNVVVARSLWIEPVLQRGAPPVVTEHASIPHAFKRRHFVIAGAPPGSHGRVWVRTNRHWQNVVLFDMVVRDRKTYRRRQLVAGIERRSVTTHATFLLKYLLSAPSLSVEFVGIGGRFQRVDIKCQGIKLFVTVSASNLIRRRELAVI